MAWAQYNIDDPMPALIGATCSMRVSDEILASRGKAQVQIPEGSEGATYVDVSVNPPVFT